MAECNSHSEMLSSTRTDPGLTLAPMTSRLLYNPGPDAFGTLGIASGTGSHPQPKRVPQETPGGEGRYLVLLATSGHQARTDGVL